MIQCLPLSICSWDFQITAQNHSAVTALNWLGEQGAINIDGEHYEVRKHGMMSGHWTLESKTQTVASAQKSNPFTRTFELVTPVGPVLLSAQSPFGRTMLLQGSGFEGSIAPVHPFTRRAMIDGQVPEFRTACFAFWLTLLLWRRAKKNSN